MELNKKHLPSLKSIQIQNFSLYPRDLDLKYEFIDGINLIIGGNGVGKTTFLNILKFALIGLYKKGIDVKRREWRGVEYRFEKRVNLPYTFFSNRMDHTQTYNENAKVILTFSFDNKTFEVTRNLFSPAIEKLVYTNNGKIDNITGKIVTQYQYDQLFSDKKKNKKELEETLQWKYEVLVGKASNLEYFENLIFLVNEVLFFSEARKTIMWNGDTQDRLLSKFFIDPQLDEQKEEAEREGKYQNSLARHYSEDIRAIKKIFDKFSSENDNQNISYADLVIKIEKEKEIIENLFNELEKIQSNREQLEVKISKLHSDKNQYKKSLEDLEAEKRKEENVLFESLFKKITPKYNEYLKSLKSSGDCPLCNNNLPHDLYEKIKDDDVHCMMCGNEINNFKTTSDHLEKIKESISQVLYSLRNKEKEILSEEEILSKMDTQFRNSTLTLGKHQSTLRQLEFSIQKFQKENNSSEDSEFKAMKERIDELEKQKDESQNKSKLAYAEAKGIISKIDLQRLQSREVLSNIFNNFGSKFLGVKCELVYEDPKDDKGKRYLPRINGIDRLDEEELSESQRFFIDQSFRMSLLSYFNSQSSFFMCETPDSSLDISYEQNAAKIYLEYVKNPNQLILTSNLNNSEFLEYLIKKANNIRYINLLKIGKQSDIQANSEQLTNASNQIEEIINGKEK